METPDPISIIYNFHQDDAIWRQAVRQALARYEGESKKIEVLHDHVEAAWKLRHAIRKQESYTRATYPMIPPTPQTTPQQALRYVIEGIEYAHRENPPTAAHAAPIWNGLYAGTWSIIDHYEQHGRRYFFLYKTDAGELDPLHLTPLQRGALSCLSRGLSDAEIATTLGTKLDAASALVRGVKKKLRIPLRRDLIGLNERCLRTIDLSSGDLQCALLYSTTALTEAIPGSVSNAERDILYLQIAGKNNNEIAQIRRVAYKTVSNQVAAAYSKLNVRTCGEMLHNLRAACR
ncbi:MAG TPA: helix-turn-helix transcriptional regulator [Kofleriaceae bacterium]|jgi:DNA-binding CsgD family transcriptional regulator|nr:helix-turn-helix transcriptional regulator [Kofleriaceae bacterium]